MTDQIPMRSASERRDAAAKVVAKFDDRTAKLDSTVETTLERELVAALRLLLEVPEVGVDEEDLIRSFDSTVFDNRDEVLRAGIRLGERMGLEHWEPADVPSQEFMLRHLGIIHRPIPENGRIGIPAQSIEKEVI